ncbi:hypothetical protein [Streptomyces griseosporeus]|uniref:hypothetical protein n=1 Tax=Streptomyces griseosporeus TaxID=1910 RepID=UPI0036FEE925
MSRALPKYNKRRVAAVGGAAAVVLSGAVIAGSALAGEPGGGTKARPLAATGTITCPDVASRLPAVPATARAEVDRNLTLLTTQIREANNRLATSAGQGGPNFVQNAILGPLKDKRASTIDRIAIAIGRTTTKPQGLDSLAGCTLGGGQGATAPQQTGTGGTGADTGKGTGTGTGAGTARGTISCPDVASRLPAVPATARAEVDRNLALLTTQIREANNRLATSAGQGGPNFVQNAILGPLKDKRASTIDRIAIAIGRTSTKPQGLGSLAGCTLVK